MQYNDWGRYLEARLAGKEGNVIVPRRGLETHPRWRRIALCGLVVGLWLLAVVGFVEMACR